MSRDAATVAHIVYHQLESICDIAGKHQFEERQHNNVGCTSYYLPNLSQMNLFGMLVTSIPA